MIRGLIGVVHVPPMPGDPRFSGASFDDTYRAALDDAAALARGGVDGIIIENFGSTPFAKGTAGDRIPPHQVAALTLVASRCRGVTDVPLGVNCLRNDALSAIGIAAAAGLDFIRVNVHVGAAVTDQGIIEGEAQETLRYRQHLDASRIAILADVLVKHATPLGVTDPVMATNETLGRGLADGIIVTGAATGAPIALERLEAIRAAAGDAAVFLGSGVTPDNAATLAPLADGAIVGTYLKQGGDVGAPVDPARVRAVADALSGRLRA